ncbi:MAG: M50 family metallopeptidase [Elusimicrobia bacterium]|nr:M50 family metallopeptidase [Elusimicrobiota bacterium]
MKRRLLGWTFALAGLALAPFALCVVAASARALVLIAGRAMDGHGRVAAWFLGGFAGYALLYWGPLRLRPAYVFAHELTHAIAAWLSGGKVRGISVGRESGHVDLSHSNPFIALAPYWVPLYAVAAVLAYRAALWAGPPPWAREAFLAVMGAALAFHLLHTGESLLAARQGDLDATGTMLGVSLIVLLNGVFALLVLKCLFPRTVDLAQSLRLAAAWTAEFWAGAWRLAR